MINVIVLIGQPGIGKSTLSMGLETAMQDVCDLCVIQNHHDRDYQAEEAEAKAKGFASMQDPACRPRSVVMAFRLLSCVSRYDIAK